MGFGFLPQRPIFKESPGTKCLLLLLLLVGIIAMFAVEPGSGKRLFFYSLGLDEGLFLKAQLWRILTYILVHGSFFHLVLNCLTLAVLGWAVEPQFGTRFLLVSFFGGGIGGGLLGAIPMAFTPSGPAIGASGGYYALVPAALSLYWNHRRYAVRWTVRLLFIFILLGDLATIFYEDPVVPLIHLGGLLAGWVIYANRHLIPTIVDSARQ